MSDALAQAKQLALHCQQKCLILLQRHFFELYFRWFLRWWLVPTVQRIDKVVWSYRTACQFTPSLHLPMLVLFLATECLPRILLLILTVIVRVIVYIAIIVNAIGANNGRWSFLWVDHCLLALLVVVVAVQGYCVHVEQCASILLVKGAVVMLAPRGAIFITIAPFLLLLLLMLL